MNKIVLFSTKQNEREKMKRRNPVEFVRRIVKQVFIIKNKRMQWLSKLSRKAKVLFAIQLLFFMSILGKVYQVQSNRIVGRSAMSVTRRARPREVSYSSFMDLAEQ